jgi:hypothetical protein
LEKSGVCGEFAPTVDEEHDARERGDPVAQKLQPDVSRLRRGVVHVSIFDDVEAWKHTIIYMRR